ncbi:MAG: hypothetical protein ACI9GW_002307 [Halieaceae bacterium]|jgi:hypothetical protein
MKGLAEYVMRGRMQALLVAVFGAGTLLFSWVSAAVIALVTLRKGEAEGSYVMMWAILPAGVVLYFGEIGPFGMIIGSLVLAVILRRTGSWQATMVAASGVGVITGLLLLTVGANYLDQVAEIFGQLFTDFEERMAEGGSDITIVSPGTLQIAGILGLMNAFSSMMCVLLARWWQAGLYNPGGFGEEFRALRLAPQVTVVTLLSGVVLVSLGIEYRVWAVMTVLPLTMAGVALVHHQVNKRDRGAQPLVFFYSLWLVFDLAKVAVVILAVVDSFRNLRGASQAEKDSE